MLVMMFLYSNRRVFLFSSYRHHPKCSPVPHSLDKPLFTDKALCLCSFWGLLSFKRCSPASCTQISSSPSWRTFQRASHEAQLVCCSEMVSTGECPATSLGKHPLGVNLGQVKAKSHSRIGCKELLAGESRSSGRPLLPSMPPCLLHRGSQSWVSCQGTPLAWLFPRSL